MWTVFLQFRDRRWTQLQEAGFPGVPAAAGSEWVTDHTLYGDENDRVTIQQRADELNAVSLRREQNGGKPPHFEYRVTPPQD